MSCSDGRAKQEGGGESRLWTEEGNSTNPWLSASDKNVAFGQGLANLRRLCIHKRAVQDFYGFRAESKKKAKLLPRQKTTFSLSPSKFENASLRLSPSGQKSGEHIYLSMAVTSISPPRRMNRIFCLSDSLFLPWKGTSRVQFWKKREPLFSLSCPSAISEGGGGERKKKYCSPVKRD